MWINFYIDIFKLMYAEMYSYMQTSRLILIKYILTFADSCSHIDNYSHMFVNMYECSWFLFSEWWACYIVINEKRIWYFQYVSLVNANAKNIYILIHKCFYVFIEYMKIYLCMYLWHHMSTQYREWVNIGRCCSKH